MNKEIIIYTTEDGKAKINLQKEQGTVLLSQIEMAELFQTTKQNISKHIKAIFEKGELDEQVVVNYKLTTTHHGAMPDKLQTKNVAYYSLDMILAIGYRVRSVRGVQFRNYATTILKEYLIKGFAMDDERLIQKIFTENLRPSRKTYLHEIKQLEKIAKKGGANHE